MFDPFSMVAGIGTSALGTGLGSLFGGGEGPTYQPSPVMESLGDYGLQQIKGPKGTKKAIKAKFKTLDPGAGEAFLQSYLGRFDPKMDKFLNKKLAKSYKRDIDYTSPAFVETAKSIYGQQGLGFTGEEYGNFAERAGSRGIRSSEAFGQMLKEDLMLSGKVMTPQQEMLSYMFGTPERDSTGRLTNRYPTIAKYTPPPRTEAVTYQYGA